MHEDKHKALIRTLMSKGIQSQTVLDAIAKVPRHLFVPPELTDQAYFDGPLPIGHGQVISQPYVVARMTECLLANTNVRKVLEIGTGSGYQAAVLAELVETVYSIERIKTLYETANKRLENLHFDNVILHYGDGIKGWPEHAPYDGIIVTAGIDVVPLRLLEQLRVGARLVIPIGGAYGQYIDVITRTEEGFQTESYDAVRFVPLLSGKE